MIQKIIYRATILFFLIVVSLFFLQCGNRSGTAGSSENIDSTAINRNNQNIAYINEREELVSNLETLKDNLDERIENLDSRIEDADEETVDDFVSMRDRLREDRSEVQSAIESLHNSSQNTWNKIKTETENLYERVSTKMDRWDERIQDPTNE